MKKIIILNWKAGPETIKEAKGIALAIKRVCKNTPRVTMVVCPPSVFLESIGKIFLSKSGVSLGSQDVSSKGGGASTGEVSAEMIKSVGGTYGIIGHSERRQMGETNEATAKKVSLAIKAGFFAVLCVGESERDSHGKYLGFLSEQIRLSLGKISRRQFSKIIIAYEPVFAIGKTEDEAMKPAELRETVIFIRKVLTDLFGQSPALAVPILYGGSVGPSNVSGLMREGGVDGLLLGRASRNPSDLSLILQAVNNTP